MKNEILNLKPERVFHYFLELSKIPRESGNERAVSNFLINTAKNLNLEVYQDKTMNVVIRKKASAGYENSPGIIIQGHMDMVCEKEPTSAHDFKNDSLDLYIEDGFLKAKDTTLGADNGIAIAMGLAILEDNSLQHPNLELLATVEEETTMKGAMELEENILKGNLLINIDSEEEAWVTAGSAGGKAITLSFDSNKDKINKNNYDFFDISLKNLFGGHSGVEIDKNRLNAIKVLTEVLINLKKSSDFSLCFVNGGSKDNAIPRECFYTLAVSKNNTSAFLDEFNKKVTELTKKYIVQEPKILFEIKKSEVEYNEIFENNILDRLLATLSELPTGVNTWLKEYPTIVESSDNLAIIKIINDKINIIISLRSSNPEILNSLEDKIKNIAKKYALNSKSSSGYPEWRFRPDSHLRDTAIKTYETLFNEKMQVSVIHAGLECGAIAKHYPNLDMISIGPNIYDVHTPKEKMDISSVEKYYKYIIELLKNLK